MRSKKHIFFSYSHNDSKFTMRLVKDFQDSGFKVWIDRINMPEGAHWDDELQEAIENAAAIVLIISPSSVKSDTVKSEISYADEINLPLIPILIDKKAKRPLQWIRLHFIYMDQKNYNDALERVLKRAAEFVSEDIEIPPPPPPPPLPTKKIFILLLLALAGIGVFFIWKYQPYFDKQIDENISTLTEQNISTKNQETSSAIQTPLQQKEKNETKKVTSFVQTTTHTQNTHNNEKNVKTPKTAPAHHPIKPRHKNKPLTPQTIQPTIPQPIPEKKSSNLSDKYERIYNNFLQKYEKDPRVRLEIVVHTNADIGKDQAKNEAQAKADKIKDLFEERGLDYTLMETEIIEDETNKITFKTIIDEQED